jgi:hypothetical protein
MQPNASDMQPHDRLSLERILVAVGFVWSLGSADDFQIPLRTFMSLPGSLVEPMCRPPK